MKRVYKSNCKYCGCKLTNTTALCGNCKEKLKLVRQIKAIGEQIKAAAEEERTEEEGAEDET